MEEIKPRLIEYLVPIFGYEWYRNRTGFQSLTTPDSEIQKERESIVTRLATFHGIELSVMTIPVIYGVYQILNRF